MQGRERRGAGKNGDVAEATGGREEPVGKTGLRVS